MFWEQLEKICKSRNITPSKLAKELNFSNAIATAWKKGSPPHSERLCAIADYFGVKKVSETKPQTVVTNKSFNEGDIVSVTVKNTNATIGMQLRNFMYKVTGNNSSTITASASGIVTINGQE